MRRHSSFQELEEAMRIGEHRERERIVSKIQERVAELRDCSKVDNCQELARLIESYIPEWTERN